MIQVISAPEHVAAFHLAGTVTADDYDKIIPEVEEKLQNHEDIGILADLTGLEDMTGGALARDFQYGLGKLGEMHRFKRAAVISDKQWIKAATEIADKVFPQVEARVFQKDEKDQAMRWVSDIH
ncbi:hypothetical protein VE25_12155 [Devosia geojensis]|uniref:STAS/SEC14 domain-containing protein n=1 Tax=Devosia geojensis TaxID=443610 RepID=A0A0F5FSK7_9HYPH|nr:STAS/SEC14 domain-containing protein [Devosia geojensis]KKB11540.1 hypothetical protein VE25_12155 [Devosia geojensis]